MKGNNWIIVCCKSSELNTSITPRFIQHWPRRTTAFISLLIALHRLTLGAISQRSFDDDYSKDAVSLPQSIDIMCWQCMWPTGLNSIQFAHKTIWRPDTYKLHETIGVKCWQLFNEVCIKCLTFINPAFQSIAFHDNNLWYFIDISYRCVYWWLGFHWW